MSNPPFEPPGPPPLAAPSPQQMPHAYVLHPVPVIRPPSGNSWGTPLIFACLGLGFAMSWASYELHARLAESSQVAVFRHDLDVIVSRESDIGQLMSDPRTQVVHLLPIDDPAHGVHSPVRQASVAWNEDRKRGIFFCDGLVPADGPARYQLWLVPAAGSATSVALAPLESGRAAYTFSPDLPASSPKQFVLTNGQAMELSEAGPALARGEVK